MKLFTDISRELAIQGKYDEFGNPEYYDDADIFKKAIEQLKNSPFVLDYSEEGYGNITFKSDGKNIIISFIIPPDVE